MVVSLAKVSTGSTTLLLLGFWMTTNCQQMWGSVAGSPVRELVINTFSLGRTVTVITWTSRLV